MPASTAGECHSAQPLLAVNEGWEFIIGRNISLHLRELVERDPHGRARLPAESLGANLWQPCRSIGRQARAA
jgi:hypothetical protein